MTTTPAHDSLRRTLACCGATLIAYVGTVHEVVGSTLYPDGPASFGGSIPWHGVGIAAIAIGLLFTLLAAGVLVLATARPR